MSKENTELQGWIELAEKARAEGDEDLEIEITNNIQLLREGILQADMSKRLRQEIEWTLAGKLERLHKTGH